MWQCREVHLPTLITEKKLERGPRLKQFAAAGEIHAPHCQGGATLI